MTYEELLKTDEWREKSLSIKKRDNFTCQNCQNLVLIESYNLRQMLFHLSLSKKGFTVSIGSMEEGAYKKRYAKFDVELYEILKKYSKPGKIRMMLYADQGEDSDFFTHLGTCFLDQKYYQYNGPRSPLGFRSPEAILQYEISLQKEIENGLYKELEWIELKLLDTHHKYYQKGKLPWEYPDSALVTLCRTCHELEHQDKIIEAKNL